MSPSKKLTAKEPANEFQAKKNKESGAKAHVRNTLSFAEYQTRAWATAKYPEKGQGSMPSLSYAVLGAAGEGGELANKWKKVLRDAGGVLTPSAKDAMLEEIGDSLWYLAALCTELGVTLEQVAQDNLEKLASRQARGVISGSGDKR
jgi:NTP pyrophosphatase (non-canonical NTP hydrolase)